METAHRVQAETATAPSPPSSRPSTRASPAPTSTSIDIPKVPDWDQKTRAGYEKEFLGFFLTEHPLNKFRVEIDSFGNMKSSEVASIAEDLKGEDSRDVTMLGFITAVVVRQDKTGRSWAIVTMEDFESSYEVKFFARSYEQYRELLTADRVIQIKGRVKVWNNRASIDAFEAHPAEQLREQATGIALEFESHNLSDDTFRGLKDLCRRFGGKRALRLAIHHEAAGLAEFRLNGDLRLTLTEDAILQLRALPGRPIVRLFV
jgi:DNA polymerase-3 subunit alpha